MIPKAFIYSKHDSFRVWIGRVGRIFGTFLSVGVPLSVVLGLTVGASEAGCRNDAITYAKARWPEAHCTALSTSACNTSNDTAICHRDEQQFLCTSDGQRPVCEELK